jgi:hypothetical protein
VFAVGLDNGLIKLFDACSVIQLQALVNNSYALPDVTVLFQLVSVAA